jgi:hypothetical protein
MGIFAMSGFQRADKLDIEPRIANINLWKPVMVTDIKNAGTSALNDIAGNMASSELKPSLRKPVIDSVAKEAVGVLGGLASRTPLGEAVTDAAKLGSEVANNFKPSSSPRGATNAGDGMANEEGNVTDKLKSQTDANMRQQLELGVMNSKMALVQAQIQVMTQNAANLKAAAKSAQQ